MRWAGHVALMGERICVYRVLMGKPEGKRPPSVDGRIILRCIFRKWDVRAMNWIELSLDRDRWQARVNAVMSLWVP